MKHLVGVAAVAAGIAFGIVGRITVTGSVQPNPGGTTIYTSNADDYSASVLAQATLHRLVSDLDVGNRPFSVSVSGDGSRVYMGNHVGAFGGSVVVIDGTTNKYLQEVTVSDSANVTDLCVAPDGSKVYAALEDSGQIAVMDTTTFGVSGPFAVPTSASSTPFPAAIDVSADGGAVFVLETNAQNIYKLSTANNQTLGSAPVSPNSRELKVSADGAVVVSVGAAPAQFFTTADMKPIAGATTVDYGTQVDVATAGTHAYVLNQNYTGVQVVTAAESGTKAVVASSGPSIDVYDVATGHYQRSIFLGVEKTVLGITALQDETQAFVSYTASENSGSVIAVDLTNGTLGLTGSTGANPVRVAVNEIGATAEILSYFLPRTLTLKIDKKGSSTKDSLIGSGYFDDSSQTQVDYVAQPVTITIGGYTRTIQLTANKQHTRFSFKDGTLNFVLNPSVRKASLGLFTIKIGKTPLGALIDATQLLQFHFQASGLPDASGSVRLTNDKYKRGSRAGDIYSPHIFPAHVIVKLGGLNKDALTLRGGFASGGATPTTLGTVKVAFGKQFARSIAGSLFTKAKNTSTFTYKSSTKGSKFSISVDFSRDFVKIDASGVELGPLSDPATDFVFDAGDGSGAFRNTIHLSKDTKGKTRNY